MKSDDERFFTLAAAAVLISTTASARFQEPAGGFRGLLDEGSLARWWGIAAEEADSVHSISEEEKIELRDKGKEKTRRQWKLKDGILEADGSELLLTTDEHFRDFELLGEWQVGEWTQAGVVLRGAAYVELWDASRVPPYYEAYGYVFEGLSMYANQGSGGIRSNTPWSAGRLPREVADRPLGEWNQMRIVMVRDRVSVWLNDVLVVDRAEVQNPRGSWLPVPESGPLQLASAHGEVRWRSLSIRDIGAEEALSLSSARPDEDASEKTWPSLEPFLASRMWPLAVAYSGKRPGLETTPEMLEIAEKLNAISFRAGGAVGEQPTVEGAVLRPEVETDEKVAWYQTVPFVVQACGELWAKESWDEADLALAQACGRFLARGAEDLDLEFSAEDPDGNRASLRAVAKWFEDQVQDDALYATMIVGTDDAPWRPIPKPVRGGSRTVEAIPLGGAAEIRILEEWTGSSQHVEIEGEGALHRVALTEGLDGHRLTFAKAGPALRLGHYGWKVRMRFGRPGDIEVLTLYLDSELRPLFYFTSW